MDHTKSVKRTTEEETSAVRFTDYGFMVAFDPTDESVGYSHSFAARTDIVDRSGRP